MNAMLRESVPLEINSGLARDRLAEQFRINRRVHVTDFLSYQDAHALERYLVESMGFQSYLVANEEEMETPPGEASILSSDDEREMLDVACDGARNGFASYFEANRSLSSPSTPVPPAGMPTMFDTCFEFLNSAEFLGFVERVTGIEKLIGAEVHATRFRPGHFVLFKNGTFSADPTGKRRLNFELNLTRQWRPEWGGLLETRGHEGHQIEGVLPCFNSLDLFTFPRGYWISQVAPFAAAARYAISGSLYVE